MRFPCRDDAGMNVRYSSGPVVGSGTYGTIQQCFARPEYIERLTSLDDPAASTRRERIAGLSNQGHLVVKTQRHDALLWEDFVFLREIDALQRTRSFPGTIDVHDCVLDTDQCCAFIVMDRMDGTLLQFIRDVPFHERHAYLPYLVVQLLLTLSYLDQHRIAHRDIKPANILLTRRWNVPWPRRSSRSECGGGGGGGGGGGSFSSSTSSPPPPLVSSSEDFESFRQYVVEMLAASAPDPTPDRAAATGAAVSNPAAERTLFAMSDDDDDKGEDFGHDDDDDDDGYDDEHDDDDDDDDDADRMSDSGSGTENGDGLGQTIPLPAVASAPSSPPRSPLPYFRRRTDGGGGGGGGGAGSSVVSPSGWSSWSSSPPSSSPRTAAVATGATGGRVRACSWRPGHAPPSWTVNSAAHSNSRAFGGAPYATCGERLSTPGGAAGGGRTDHDYVRHSWSGLSTSAPTRCGGGLGGFADTHLGRSGGVRADMPRVSVRGFVSDTDGWEHARPSHTESRGTANDALVYRNGDADRSSLRAASMCGGLPAVRARSATSGPPEAAKTTTTRHDTLWPSSKGFTTTGGATSTAPSSVLPQLSWCPASRRPSAAVSTAGSAVSHTNHFSAAWPPPQRQEVDCAAASMLTDADGTEESVGGTATPEFTAAVEQNVPVVVLCDFGLAKQLSRHGDTPCLVTLNFRPPELFGTDRPLAYRTNIDVWSLGCTLVEYLTGRMLFLSRDEPSFLREMARFTRYVPSQWYLHYPPTVMASVVMSATTTTTTAAAAKATRAAAAPRPSAPRRDDTRLPRTTWTTSRTRWSARLRRFVVHHLRRSNAEAASANVDVAHDTPSAAPNDAAVLQQASSRPHLLFDLLACMLCPDASLRPSATELLGHAYVRPYVEQALDFMVSTRSYRDAAATTAGGGDGGGWRTHPSTTFVAGVSPWMDCVSDVVGASAAARGRPASPLPGTAAPLISGFLGEDETGAAAAAAAFRRGSNDEGSSSGSASGSGSGGGCPPRRFSTENKSSSLPSSSSFSMDVDTTLGDTGADAVACSERRHMQSGAAGSTSSWAYRTRVDLAADALDPRLGMHHCRHITLLHRELMCEWIWFQNTALRFRGATGVASICNLDRFLSRASADTLTTLTAEYFVLCGIVCMYLTAQYYEAKPVHLRALTRYCGYRYQAVDEQWAIQLVLTALQFQISTPAYTAFRLYHGSRGGGSGAAAAQRPVRTAPGGVESTINAGIHSHEMVAAATTTTTTTTAVAAETVFTGADEEDNEVVVARADERAFMMLVYVCLRNVSLALLPREWLVDCCLNKWRLHTVLRRCFERGGRRADGRPLLRSVCATATSAAAAVPSCEHMACLRVRWHASLDASAGTRGSSSPPGQLLPPPPPPMPFLCCPLLRPFR